MNEKELSSYAKNIYSQFGEDGIIEEILKRIGRSADTDGWCVEFGAWDGLHLSNTYHLINDKAFKAVLIEGDREKYLTLCNNIPRDDVYKICRFVNFEGTSTLDNILRSTPIPAGFDFLSIDIDGCDYFIFDSLKEYRPKIVCIEYNPTIPNEVEFIQPRDFGIKQGASARSLMNLGIQKGYSLAAVTACNLILVRNDLLKYVGQCGILENLRDDSHAKMFLFVGYDGTILSNRSELDLVWHGISQNVKDMQLLPKKLRVFYTDYGTLQRALFYIWLAIKKPSVLGNKVIRALKKQA